MALIKTQNVYQKKLKKLQNNLQIFFCFDKGSKSVASEKKKNLYVRKKSKKASVFDLTIKN